MGWDALKSELLSAFGREASFDAIFQKFANLNPKSGQTLHSFLQELMRLARLISASDKMLSAKLVPHLPESLKALVHMYRPQTGRELSDLLREHSHVVLSRPASLVAPLMDTPQPPQRPVAPRFNQPQPHSQPQRQHYRHQTGPQNFSRPQPRPSHGPQGPSRSDNSCGRCGYTDCTGIRCPAANAKCRNCNKIGHFQKKCRSSKYNV